MKKIISFSLIWVVLLTIACNQDDTADVKTPTPKQGENFKFFASDEMYNDALGKRSGDYSAPFEILDVAAVKDSLPTGHDFLLVTVEYDESCEGEFEVIWDGRIMESYPVQTHLIMKYNAACSNTNQKTIETIAIDLDEFIGDALLVDEAVFHLLNASKINTSNDVDYDATTSSD